MSSSKLQLTNGYDVNFDQLAQFVAAMERDERRTIPVADLGESIGVPYRQAESVGSIMRAFDLARWKTYRPTALAHVIGCHDRFFDDIGTLWFLHYVIASEPRHLVWNRLVHELAPKGQAFSRDEFRALFADIAVSHSPYSFRSHVLKETNVVLETYTQQNFARLAYLRADGERYMLSYREPVPPLVLAACIARYRNRHRPDDSAISVDDLLSAPNSPGVVCQIPEDRLRAGLEALKTEPGFSLESRADLDQVRLTDKTQDYEWMERYYRGR